MKEEVGASSETLDNRANNEQPLALIKIEKLLLSRRVRWVVSPGTGGQLAETRPGEATLLQAV